jgi:hypothetical protein
MTSSIIVIYLSAGGHVPDRHLKPGSSINDIFILKLICKGCFRGEHNRNHSEGFNKYS